MYKRQVEKDTVYENGAERKDTVHPDIDGLIGAIRAKNLEQIAGHMGNVLETVTIPNYPVIAEIKAVSYTHLSGTAQGLPAIKNPYSFRLREPFSYRRASGRGRRRSPAG